MTARRKDLPFWPARLSEDMAADYLSIGKTTLRERVAKGVYPQPISDGGRKFYSLRQLSRFVDAQFGLTIYQPEGDESWADLR